MTIYGTVDISEKIFEDHVEQFLEDSGWKSYRLEREAGVPKAGQADYDRDLALKLDSLIGFIKDTQPKEWAKIEGFYDNPEAKFAAQLNKELRFNGLVEVLRHGMKMAPGARFKLCYFKPESSINTNAWTNYSKNRFEVVRQLYYGTFPSDKNNSLDVVLFLNGIPVVTIELKNHQTSQNVNDAIRQYRINRDPKETIFKPNDHSLVHFAVDSDLVRMTTWLKGPKTFFLPFDKGNGKAGAGNPPDPVNGFRTAYLFKETLAADSLLEIIEKFVQAEYDDKGNLRRVLFPRYHQLDAVRKLVADVKEFGPGKNYLIQHSAGSGKSNTIAWLAHQLSSLTNETGNSVFDSIIVLTDRIVLDDQLQNTIYSMEHKEGVVEKIEKGSAQLLNAINSGKRIIISTIQKFPYIYQNTNVEGRTFAIIIDEAHSSQSGKSAQKTKQALSSNSTEEELDQALVDAAQQDSTEEKNEEKHDAQAAVFAEMSAQGNQKNLSFFAFTATPKVVTMELFGTKGEDGKPHPFSLYSMKQAIEEKFILDVLKNYTTFDTYFKLVKSIEADPKYEAMAASRSLMNFVKLHPANITRKAQIMIEHFRGQVMPLLNHKAKAMVVTSSRLAAVRYTSAFKAYIEEKGYKDMDVMVAYSGSVDQGFGPMTESDMNGFPDTETRARFATDDYQVMIVANKYQTGFDQPLLCAMYVDKVLTGIAAVQTLSRLNRTYPGKEEVFVLDFVNDWETIKASFEDYYTVTEIDRTTDPNVVYDIERRLEGYRIYTAKEVEAVADTWYNAKDRSKVLPKVLSALEPAKQRFEAIGDENRQYEFRELAKKFVRSYGFITQMVRLSDMDLHYLNLYLTFLLKELPKPSGSHIPNLNDEVDLDSLRIDEIGTRQIQLDGGTELKNGGANAGVKPEDPKEPLSEIIKRINAQYGTKFEKADKILKACLERLDSDEDLVLKAKNNSREDFETPFTTALNNVLMEQMLENEEFFKLVGTNEDFLKALSKELFNL
ncbi:MAG: type I restriction endonuclease subunit R, partial [Anaerotardibacter sp.]